MADLTPYAKVRDALPGTLHEIAERTGYSPGEVLHQIVALRKKGVRVNAVRDPDVHALRMDKPGDLVASTTYHLDDPSRGE